MPLIRVGGGAEGEVCILRCPGIGRILTAGKILFTGRQTCSLYLVLGLCVITHPHVSSVKYILPMSDNEQIEIRIDLYLVIYIYIYIYIYTCMFLTHQLQSHLDTVCSGGVKQCYQSSRKSYYMNYNL